MEYPRRNTQYAIRNTQYLISVVAETMTKAEDPHALSEICYDFTWHYKHFI